MAVLAFFAGQVSAQRMTFRNAGGHRDRDREGDRGRMSGGSKTPNPLTAALEKLKQSLSKGGSHGAMPFVGPLPKPAAPAPAPPEPAAPAVAETSPVPRDVPNPLADLPVPVVAAGTPDVEDDEQEATTPGMSTGAIAATVGIVGFSALLLVGVAVMVVQNRRTATPKYRRRRTQDEAEGADRESA